MAKTKQTDAGATGIAPDGIKDLYELKKYLEARLLILRRALYPMPGDPLLSHPGRLFAGGEVFAFEQSLTAVQALIDHTNARKCT